MMRTKSVRIETVVAEADAAAVRADAIKAARIILSRRAGAPTEIQSASVQPTRTSTPRRLITA